jgi:hypothetical protein
MRLFGNILSSLKEFEITVNAQHQLPSEGEGTIKGFAWALSAAYALRVQNMFYLSLRWWGQLAEG